MEKKDQELLLSACHHETYSRNSVIWKHKSGKKTGVLLILEGILKARFYADSDSIFLFFLKKGDLSMLSAPSLIGNINTHIELVAKEDVEVLRIEEAVYSQLESLYPRLLLSTDYYLAKVLEKLTGMLRRRLHASVEKNLSNYLIDHMQAYESPVVQISHQELADDIGTRREVASRVLYKLKDEGILDLSRKQIRILDITRLDEKTRHKQG